MQSIRQSGSVVSLVVYSMRCSLQEPGTNAEIKEFAHGKYGATYDLYAKIKVNGDDALPLYKYLKSKQGGMLGRCASGFSFHLCIPLVL